MASKSTALNEYVLLGNSGLRVSPLCLGAMTWGTLWEMGGSKDDAKAIFTEYCQNGGNFIDTANKYHEGESEEWLGEFMEEANNRDDLVIATKFTLPMPSSSKLKVDGAVGSGLTGLKTEGKSYSINGAGNTNKNLQVSLAASLKRLRTTYIDILYVHHWDWTVDTQELMKSLNDVVASGKVLYLGISDAPSWVVAECNAIARARGWAPFQVAQHRYSLLDRTIEQDVLNYALYRPLAVVNWAVLGSGVLTGKYKRGEETKETKDSQRAKSGWVQPTDKDFEIADAVTAVATEIGCSPSQVAIAWARAQPGITSPLIGCRTLAQYKDNVGALKIKLNDEQLKRLTEVSKITLGFPFNFVGTGVDSCPWPKTAGKIVV